MKEYIDRSTLLAIIFAKFNEHYGKSRAQAIHDFYRFVTKKICVAPAADVVEVRHGFWVEKQIPLNWCEDDVDVVYTCSICGNDDIGKCRYCPHCGAKMDKEKV